MKIVIVGGGVMGRLWTGRLASAGHDVAIIDASPQVVSELNRDGVSIQERDDMTRHAPARAGTGPDGLDTPDMAFFFVKTDRTAEAADRVAPAIGPDTAVVTLQNGLGNGKTLAERFPARQIVVGSTEQGGALTPDRRVLHAHDGDTIVGPYVEGGDAGFAVRVAAALRAAGLKAEAVPSIAATLWRKRIFAASVLPVAALTGLPAARLLDARVFPAVAALAGEALAEANADGCEFRLDEQLERITSLLSAAPQAKASMLQDVQARRGTEIDAVTGAIAERAAARGASATVCAAITALVHGRELAWHIED